MPPHLPGQPIFPDRLSSGRLSAGKLVQAMMARHGHLQLSNLGEGAKTTDSVAGRTNSWSAAVAVGGSTSGGTAVAVGGSTSGGTVVPEGGSRLARPSLPPVPCTHEHLLALGTMPDHSLSDGLSSLHEYCRKRTSDGSAAAAAASNAIHVSVKSAQPAEAPSMSHAAQDAASSHQHSRLKEVALRPGSPQACGSEVTRGDDAPLLALIHDPTVSASASPVGGGGGMVGVSHEGLSFCLEPAAATSAATGPVYEDWMSEWGAAAAATAGNEEGEEAQEVLPLAAAAAGGGVGGAPAVGGIMKSSVSSKVCESRGSCVRPPPPPPLLCSLSG